MAFGSGTPAQAGKATVKYGSQNDTDGLFVGRTVSEVRGSRAAAWNIPTDARAYRGRDTVGDDYVIKAGDTIEFARRMGEKG
jgi:hypothetical protein